MELGEYLFQSDDGSVVLATATRDHQYQDIPVLISYDDGIVDSYSDSRFVDRSKFTPRNKDVKHAVWLCSRRLLRVDDPNLMDELSDHGDSLDIVEFVMCVEDRTGTHLGDLMSGITFGQFELIVTKAVEQLNL